MTICPLITRSLVVVALVGPAQGVSQVANDDQDLIRRSRLAQNEALAERDFDAASSFWVESIVVTAGLGAVISGKQAYRSAFENDVGVTYQRLPESIEISSGWSLAFETGRWQGRNEANQTMISGWYSAQWVKQDGTWRIRSELFVAEDCSGQACAWGLAIPPT